MVKNDLELYQDIKEKIDFEPGINAHKITFSTYNGVVIINGTVGSYLEKRLIKRAISHVAGVKAIADEMVVNYETAAALSDSDIAEAALKALEWDITLPANAIKLNVEKGRITLSGEVQWQYQRQNAENDVHHLPGVVAIDNLIEIKPQLAMATADEVKQRISREFERHALLDAQDITIEVVDSCITLKGTLHSWAESHEAAHIAWSIPGVTKVDNQINIK